MGSQSRRPAHDNLVLVLVVVVDVVVVVVVDVDVNVNVDVDLSRTSCEGDSEPALQIYDARRRQHLQPGARFQVLRAAPGR